jgi:hypothetical protein
MTAPKKPRKGGHKSAKTAVANAIEPPAPKRPSANERMVFLQDEIYERLKRLGNTP